MDIAQAPKQIQPAQIQEQGPDYPALFRAMIVRSTQAALAALGPQALKLEEEERRRSLYLLSLALDLPAAWRPAVELTLALAPYMEMQGFGPEWMGYLEKAISQAQRQQDGAALAKLHSALGWLYRLSNDYPLAERHLLAGRDLARKNNDKATQAQAVDRLAVCAVEQADFPRARQYIDETMQLLEAGDPLYAHSYSRLGLIALRQGNWDEAIQRYMRSLHLFTVSQQARFAAQTERHLGFALIYAKRYAEAVEHYQNSLALLSQADSLVDWASTQMELGVAYWYTGDCQAALALYKLCEPAFVKTNSRILLAHLYNNRGLALRELGAFAQAKEALAASVALMRELQHPLWIANALESLGGLYQRMGEREQAVATWEQALQELQTLPETPRYLHDLILQRLQEAKTAPG